MENKTLRVFTLRGSDYVHTILIANGTEEKPYDSEKARIDAQVIFDFLCSGLPSATYDAFMKILEENKEDE